MRLEPAVRSPRQRPGVDVDISHPAIDGGESSSIQFAAGTEAESLSGRITATRAPAAAEQAARRDDEMERCVLREGGVQALLRRRPPIDPDHGKRIGRLRATQGMDGE
jgi:hypothetical protein